MSKLRGWALGLLFVFGAALVYPAAAMAAETSTATNQGVEKKVTRKHMKKKPGVKKRKSKKMKAVEASPAPATDSVNKS